MIWRSDGRERGTSGRGRLAYVSLHRASPGQGGHTHIHEICSSLEKCGWEVDLFAPSAFDKDRRSSFDLLAQLLLPQVRLLLRWRRYDVVYSRHHPLAALVVLASQVTGMPRVEEVNGTLDDWLQVHPWSRMIIGWLSRLSARSLRHATDVIVVNDGLDAWVRDLSGRRSITVPNGADPETFVPMEESASPYVTFAGALTPWEGVETMLIAAESASWPVDVQLRVAGAGPLDSRVRDVARRCGHVQYLGRVSQEDVASLVGSAIAALSPFYKPPYGASAIKTYEAMASGVPVIVSDSPGQAEVVREEECGLIFPAGDASALCDAVKALATAPELRHQLGQNGRRAAVARHSWARRAERTDAILMDAKLHGRRRSSSPRISGRSRFRMRGHR
jgi:glycosyltransferase involved in cell wall biosynthesis